MILLNLFADDTTLFYSSKIKADTENILNNEIVKVTDWLISNKLSLNIKKSCYLTFSLTKSNHYINVNDKRPTNRRRSVIDNKLNWKDHIKHKL